MSFCALAYADRNTVAAVKICGVNNVGRKSVGKGRVIKILPNLFAAFGVGNVAFSAKTADAKCRVGYDGIFNVTAADGYYIAGNFRKKLYAFAIP